MEQTKDRRIQKTRMALHSAFLELLCTKDIAKITVTELVDKANVNRKTFYNHYTDIYEVLDDIENELIKDFARRIRKIGWNQFLDKPSLLMHEAIRELQDNKAIALLLVYSGDNSNLLSKVVQEEKKMLREIYQEKDSEHEEWVDYFLNFFAAGTMAVFETWFHAERRPPINDITEFFDAFSQIFKEQWFLEAKKQQEADR